MKKTLFFIGLLFVLPKTFGMKDLMPQEKERNLSEISKTHQKSLVNVSSNAIAEELESDAAIETFCISKTFLGHDVSNGIENTQPILPRDALKNILAHLRQKHSEFSILWPKFFYTHTGYSFDVSPDGTLIAKSTKDGKVSIWDIETNKNIYTLNTVANETVRYSPDGTYLLTADGDQIHVWNAKTYDPVSTYKGSDPSFSLDGKEIIAVGEIISKPWECEHRLGYHPVEPGMSAIQPAGTSLIHSPLETVNGGCVFVERDLCDDNETTPQTGINRVVYFKNNERHSLDHKNNSNKRFCRNSIAVAPNGQYVAVVSRYPKGRGIVIWDLLNPASPKYIDVDAFADGRYELCYPAKEIAFSPDNKYIVVQTDFNEFTEFDRETGKQTRTFQYPPENLKKLSSVKYMPDGKSIIAASPGKKIYLWRGNINKHFGDNSNEVTLAKILTVFVLMKKASMGTFDKFFSWLKQTPFYLFDPKEAYSETP